MSIVNYTTTHTPTANSLIDTAPVVSVRPRHYSAVTYPNGLTEKIENWESFLTDNPCFVANFGSNGFCEVQRVASYWHAIVSHEDRLFTAVLGRDVTPALLCKINDQLSGEIKRAAEQGLVKRRMRYVLASGSKTLYHYSADPFVRPLSIRECENLPLEILESVAYRLNTASMAEIAKHVRVTYAGRS
jgi:hypothetical protein